MPSRRGSPGSAPYQEMAEAYDILHADRPYAQEARAIRALVRRHAGPSARTLLDVACGTGRHLEHLVRWFDCTGLDSSAAMLARARQRAPSARYVKGRMQDVPVGGRFDVVTCLFSAIGYLRSRAELERTLSGFSGHLAVGGVVIVEPFLTPEAWRTPYLSTETQSSGDTRVLRMSLSSRRRQRAILDLHYLVGTPGRVRYVHERHDLALFGTRTMLGAFRAAGLRAVHLLPGLSTGRGLYVAVKEGRPAPPPRRTASGA